MRHSCSLLQLQVPLAKRFYCAFSFLIFDNSMASFQVGSFIARTSIDWLIEQKSNGVRWVTSLYVAHVPVVRAGALGQTHTSFFSGPFHFPRYSVSVSLPLSTVLVFHAYCTLSCAYTRLIDWAPFTLALLTLSDRISRCVLFLFCDNMTNINCLLDCSFGSASLIQALSFSLLSVVIPFSKWSWARHYAACSTCECTLGRPRGKRDADTWYFAEWKQKVSLQCPHISARHVQP